MVRNGKKVAGVLKRARKIIGIGMIALPIVMIFGTFLGVYTQSTGNNSGASETAALLAGAKGGFATPGQYRAAVALMMAQHLYGAQANQYHAGDPVFSSALAYWKQTCRAGDGSLCTTARSGSLQCVEFVSAVFATTDNDLPLIGQADQFWNFYQHEPGWQEIAAAAFPTRGGPQPGDILVFSGGAFGHIALVVTSQPPQGKRAGSILVAQANAPLNLETMTWNPDNSLSAWPGYRLQGVIRQEARAPCLQDATVQQQHWEVLSEQAAVHFGIPSLEFLRQICLASAFGEGNGRVPPTSDRAAPAGIARLDTRLAAQVPRCVLDLTQPLDCANHAGRQGIDPTNPQEALPAAASVIAKLYLHYLSGWHAANSVAAYEMAVAAYAVGQATVDQAVRTCESEWLTCLGGKQIAQAQASYLPPPSTLAHYVTAIMRG